MRQSLTAVVASALLYVIASGAAGFDVTKGFASNGYDGIMLPASHASLASLPIEVCALIDEAAKATSARARLT